MRGLGSFTLCNPTCSKATINSELLTDDLTEVATCMLNVEGGLVY